MKINPDQNGTMVAVNIARTLSEITNHTNSLTKFNLHASLEVIATLTKAQKEEAGSNDEIKVSQRLSLILRRILKLIIAMLTIMIMIITI